MTFIERIRERASTAQRRIVFPESNDARVLAAAIEIDRIGMARVVLVVDGRPSEAIKASGLVTVAADDGSPLELSHRMVGAGEADASVAGAVYTTRVVLRSALRHVGLAA
jgi:phosphotransacetylase